MKRKRTGYALRGRKSLHLEIDLLPKINSECGMIQHAENVKEENDDDDNDDVGLSEYERQRLLNIKRNEEMLHSLNIAEDARLLKSKNRGSVTPRPKLTVRNTEPVRRSPRIGGKTPGERLQLHNTSSATYVQNAVSEQPTQYGPIGAVPRNDIAEADNEAFLKALGKLGKMTKITTSVISAEDACLNSYKERISKLCVKANNVLKVVPSRITTMAVHPSCSQTIICAGDKYGNIGFWDVEAKGNNTNNLFIYHPHSSNVKSMCFHPAKDSDLFSCSADGMFRRTDFNTCVFDEVYSTDYNMINSFSYPYNSRDTFLLAFGDGKLALVDARESKDKSRSYTCHRKAIKCVHCSPVNEYLFCTSSSEASVALWDIRKLKNIKSTRLDIFEGHSRSVSSAYFTPVDGKYILSTSFDDTVKVLEVTAASKFEVKKNVRHHNQTGRWLSSFKATWDPRNGRGFVIGSMLQNRRVQFYHVEQKTVSPLVELYDENYTTITSTNVFHNSRNLLAAGNSSGKVYLWSD